MCNFTAKPVAIALYQAISKIERQNTTPKENKPKFEKLRQELRQNILNKEYSAI